jgi:methyl-accepting chemotaxis protein
MMMSAIRNLPVARKFALAFGLVCVLCVSMGSYTFITFRNIAANSSDVSGNSFPSVVALSNIRASMNAARRQELNLLLCQTPTCITEDTAIRQKALLDYRSAVKEYEPETTYPGEKELFQKFTSAFAQYEERDDQALASLAAGKVDEALGLTMSDSTVAMFDTAIRTTGDDFELNVKSGTEEAAAVARASTLATWTTLGITAIIGLLCGLTGMALTRVIAPPLRAATAALERVAAKDLTATVESNSAD